MSEQKSDEYKKAEGKLAGIIFLVFLAWGGAYLVLLRPALNDFLREHSVTSYPAMPHLIPILAPVIVLALILARLLPPKQ